MRPRPATARSATTPVIPPATRQRSLLSMRALRVAGLVQTPVARTAHPRIRARAEAAARVRRRREMRITLLVLGVAVAGLVSYGTTRSPLFDIHTVALRGVEPTQAAALAGVLEGTQGTNAFDLDLAAVTAAIDSLPWTSGVVVRRHLPDTLEVRVAVATPVVSAVVEDTRYLVDEAGVVVEAVAPDGRPASMSTDAAALPTVTMVQAPVVGDQVAMPSVRNAAAIAAAMPVGLRQWIVSYHAAADTAMGAATPGPRGEVDVLMRIPTAGGEALEFTAHLGRATDMDRKAAALGALIDEVRARGLTPAGLDVRIPDRPVIQT
ncbi:cell division protein FtsQ/DivIB [Euzebya tangerina]|uniref:cell division protein FtsQ/DivIB n=1 Tax=Euzebya tangerina TaxID=591198 RepID=UPI000E31B009|nr:FtsQ-type POTRA domain-containing protein [Euzebya tangerina]